MDIWHFRNQPSCLTINFNLDLGDIFNFDRICMGYMEKLKIVIGIQLHGSHTDVFY